MSRLGKGPVVVGLLVLGVLLVAVATRPWVGAAVDGGGVPVGAGGSAVSATGSAVTPVSALGLVVLATGGAMLLARRWVVVVLGVVALLAAAGAAAAGVRVLVDPVGAALPLVASARGLTADSLPRAEVRADATGWVVVALVLAVLVVLLAVAAVLRGRHWGASRRYERDTAPAATPPGPGATPAPADDWDALTRGEDPTSR